MPKLLQSKCKAKTVKEFQSLDNLQEMLAVKAVFHLDSTHHLLESSKEHNNVKQNDLFATDV